MRGGGVDPVIAVGGTAGDQLGIPTVADLRPGLGPLGGLATALLWARTGWVVVAPCDLPLLEPADVTALVAGRLPTGRAAGPDRPVVAVVDGRPQVSLSCWPAADGRRLLALLDGGDRALRGAIDGLEWTGVDLSPRALADADTPEELDRLGGGGSR
jgi:molybdopterin-guanine dinucleotide biosynthesis protein A